MDWKENVSFDKTKILYKGIDIDLSREFIQDLRHNLGIYNDFDLYEFFENKYNEKIEVIRNYKLNEILN